MRLINTSTLELHEFGDNDRPQYAILSHTWGADDEEVTFQEMQEPTNSRSQQILTKPGYQKILKLCELAKAKDLDYVWVDTCCIDKSSSAELTESINSMYRWYKDAEECYAYLADFEASYSYNMLSDMQWQERLKLDLRKCRWSVLVPLRSEQCVSWFRLAQTSDL